MGMNGKVGRAKTLKAIRKRELAEAKAAGVDVTDFAAVKAFHDAKFWQMVERHTGNKRPSR